jgi:lactoylglutathione lyase/glyoxylase I family protein
MADQSPFSTSTIHHIGLRVADVKAVAAWLTTMLGFRVEREFEVMGNPFMFLSAGGAGSPVIELIGGPMEPERPLPDDPLQTLAWAGLHHVCLQVPDVERLVADLRGRGVRIFIDVRPGIPETGVDKVAFVADPWGNLYELVQLAKS